MTKVAERTNLILANRRALIKRFNGSRCDYVQQSSEKTHCKIFFQWKNVAKIRCRVVVSTAERTKCYILRHTFPFSYFVFSFPTESIDNSVWKFENIFTEEWRLNDINLSFHCPNLRNDQIMDFFSFYDLSTREDQEWWHHRDSFMHTVTVHWSVPRTEWNISLIN